MEQGNDSRHNCGVHWEDWNGHKLPRRLGGHPALDFCNTWAGWAEPDGADDPAREWLRDYGDLLAWSEYAGLVPEGRGRELARLAEQHPRQAVAVLAEARTLREAVHAAVLDPADAASLEAVTAVARRAGAHAAVVPSEDGPARWQVGDAGLEQPLLAVAWAAAELLTSPDVLSVSACPGAVCGWVFLDRRGRRRWCDMAVCGNRAKVAAHARRVRGAAS